MSAIPPNTSSSNVPPPAGQPPAKKGGHVGNLIAKFEEMGKVPSSSPKVETAFKPVDYLTKYPEKELHRLVVDGRLLVGEGGWQKFEDREPGCLRDFFTALRFIKDNISTPLTLGFISQVQALAGKSALKNTLGAPGEFYHNPFGGFMVGAHRIEIGDNNCSALGIKQFLDQIQKEGPKYLGVLNIDGVMIHKKNIPELLEKYQCQNTQELAEKIYQMTLGGKRISITCLEPDDIEERVGWIIDSYKKAIKEAGDEESRLKVIVEHVQLFEQLHPFPDVNNRTFVGLILQKLLIENGFTPVTLWNYNIFDLYSRDEIIAKLKEGMNHTRNLVAGKPALDFDSKTLSKESEASLARHTAPLHAKEAVKANPRFAYIDLLLQFQTELFKKVEAFEKKGKRVAP